MPNLVYQKKNMGCNFPHRSVWRIRTPQNSQMFSALLRGTGMIGTTVAMDTHMAVKKPERLVHFHATCERCFGLNSVEDPGNVSMDPSIAGVTVSPMSGVPVSIVSETVCVTFLRRALEHLVSLENIVGTICGFVGATFASPGLKGSDWELSQGKMLVTGHPSQSGPCRHAHLGRGFGDDWQVLHLRICKGSDRTRRLPDPLFRAMWEEFAPRRQITIFVPM
ncbi:MAG: hypothetical protein Q9169_001217 [Polycauliona sp. 2 TL-2023]